MSRKDGPPAIPWCKVFQQLNAGTLRGTQRRDTQPRAENVVQMLLFGAVVFALSRNTHPQGVSIEREACIRIADDDGCVVDAEKKPVPGTMPSGVSLVRRKLQDFEEVAIGIAEIERPDAGRTLLFGQKAGLHINPPTSRGFYAKQGYPTRRFR